MSPWHVSYLSLDIFQSKCPDVNPISYNWWSYSWIRADFGWRCRFERRVFNTWNTLSSRQMQSWSDFFIWWTFGFFWWMWTLHWPFCGCSQKLWDALYWSLQVSIEKWPLLKGNISQIQNYANRKLWVYNIKDMILTLKNHLCIHLFFSKSAFIFSTLSDGVHFFHELTFAFLSFCQKVTI